MAALELRRGEKEEARVGVRGRWQNVSAASNALLRAEPRTCFEAKWEVGDRYTCPRDTTSKGDREGCCEEDVGLGGDDFSVGS